MSSQTLSKELKRVAVFTCSGSPVDTKDESGKLICTNEFSLFIRGEGNFGGLKTSTALRTSVQVPSGRPDKTMTQATHSSQVSRESLAD